MIVSLKKINRKKITLAAPIIPSDVEIKCSKHGKQNGIHLGNFDYICVECYIESMNRFTDSGRHKHLNKKI